MPIRIETATRPVPSTTSLEVSPDTSKRTVGTDLPIFATLYLQLGTIVATEPDDQYVVGRKDENSRWPILARYSTTSFHETQLLLNQNDRTITVTYTDPANPTLVKEKLFLYEDASAFSVVANAIAQGGMFNDAPVRMPTTIELPQADVLPDRLFTTVAELLQILEMNSILAEPEDLVCNI